MNSYLSSLLIEDGEYEVTAEMLIHEDMDDERTLEEEEALQDQVEVMEELSNLEKVSVCLNQPCFLRSHQIVSLARVGKRNAH